MLDNALEEQLMHWLTKTNDSLCKSATKEIDERLEKARVAFRTNNLSNSLDHALVVIGAQALLIKHLIPVVDSKVDAEI